MSEPQKLAYANCVNPSLHEAVSAWFLGPQAENEDILKHLFNATIDMQKESRLCYYRKDGPFITAAIKESQTFQERKNALITEYMNLSTLLFKKSVPFFSQRYAGHMCFEMSIPGMLGWVSGVLNNPNNVAFEASPYTTILEIEASEQICEMLGYTEKVDKKPLYWGHITCDGTVANLESIWVARNIKYYPLSLRDAMKPGNELNYIADTFEVPLPTGGSKRLADLSLWQLLNLTAKTILDVPIRLESEYGITPTYLDAVLGKYIVQTRGKQAVEVEWGMKTSPRYFISSTKHYSWPKGAAIAGIGSENMFDIPIDTDARIDTTILREQLQSCLDKQVPVFAVVGIIGSTEEGSVDALDKILNMRDEFEAKGLCFLVHADAAWGGYFAAMIRNKPVHKEPDQPRTVPHREFVPSATLRESTVNQLRALARTDSITIDPHKAGYIPYPAGSLCYRDGRMRYLVTWTAPYLQQSSEKDQNIGIYGVEGSKPGAAAVATWLHHRVVGLHNEGHGALLGEVSWSCRRISAHWAAMSVDEDPFIVVPLNPLRAEPDPTGVAEQKKFIRLRILGQPNEVIIADKDAMAELCDLGSDLNINAFACNFRINGVANTDVEEANYLNNEIFRRLSVTSPKTEIKDIPMFLSATTFKVAEYGVCVRRFKERLQLETESDQDLFVLRNVVMSPFQTAGNFVQQLADTFQGILEEEMKHVVARNTITSQDQSFVVLGYDTDAPSSQAFLVYRPYFHNANGRFQVILSVDIDDDPKAVKAPPNTATSDPVTLNIENTTMANICIEGATFNATISTMSIPKQVRVSNVKVIKNRALDSRWRDNKYPASFVPFYLFGANGRTFVDHALVKAPNAQLCAEVSLNVSLSADQLARGVLLSVARPEVAMQPAEAATTAWFAAGASYAISVYDDPNPAVAHGPGLVATIGCANPVATGTMTVLKNVHVDFARLNTPSFKPKPPTAGSKGEEQPDEKLTWRQYVDNALGGSV